METYIRKEIADLWNVLPQEDKEVVMENFKIHHFKKNELIYAENEDPEFLWILLQGKVKKFKYGISDRPQIIRMYRPVQYFGYRAFFASEKYVSSAGAFEASTVGSLPMKLVASMLDRNIALAKFFIHDLSRHLGGSDTKIVNLTQKHIRGRLAEALLLLLDSYGLEDDGATIRIYMSREDLANLSNMTTSNAIRTLSCFVNEKLILVDGRKIKIINEPQLRKISKYG